MKISSRALLRGRWMLALPAVLGMAAASCTDRAADLELRLSTLQQELDRTKAELEAANRKETPAPGAALASVSEIESNYDRQLREFRQELEGQMSNGRVNSVTAMHPVIDEKPYTAGFALEATLQGRSVTLDRVPVRAGLDGKWSFPTAAEVLDRLAKGSASAATGASDSRSVATARSSPADPQPRELVSPMQATQTIRIDWGDRPAGGRPPAEPAKGQPGAREGAPRF